MSKTIRAVCAPLLAALIGLGGCALPPPRDTFDTKFAPTAEQIEALSQLFVVSVRFEDDAVGQKPRDLALRPHGIVLDARSAGGTVLSIGAKSPVFSASAKKTALDALIHVIYPSGPAEPLKTMGGSAYLPLNEAVEVQGPEGRAVWLTLKEIQTAPIEQK